ncbi:MMPL family transporter [Candidatus Acetothermia bacterium]|nr:MMPL family transporter [Candidatus Acetothermia bacterium]MBI3643548.1 MMPL family transporter [Candidatus Acetothermia bacterium]
MRQRLLLGIYRLTRYYAWAVLVFFLTLALLSLFFLRNLPINSSLQELLPRNDSLVERMQEQQKQLEDTEEITVLLHLTAAPPSEQAGIDELKAAAQQIHDAICTPSQTGDATCGEFIWVRYQEPPAPVTPFSFNLTDLENGVAALKAEVEQLNKAATETPNLEEKFGSLTKSYNDITQALDQLLSGLVVFSPQAQQIVNLGGKLNDLKSFNGSVYTILDQLPSKLTEAQAEIDKVRQYLNSIEPQQASSIDDGLRLSEDKQSLLVSVRPQRSSQEGIDYNGHVIGIVRDSIQSLHFDAQGIETGLVGPYVFSAESDSEVRRDTSLATLITIIGVLILFMVVLRRYFYPLLATFPILIALIFTVAAAKLFFGGLNLVTAFLPAIVLGLGIDYGIQFITHYMEERRGSRRVAPALRATLLIKGRAMLSAASAASLVMLALGIIAKTAGLSQIGYILAIGVILSCFMTLVLLPALIIAVNAVLGRRLRSHPPRPWNLTGGARLIIKARWAIIGFTIIGSIVILFPASKVDFKFVDDNLQPTNLPSNHVSQFIQANFKQGPNRGNVFVFFVENDKARMVTEQLSQMEAVDRVEGFYKSIPEPENLEKIKGFLQELKSLDPVTPLQAIDRNLEYLHRQLEDADAIRSGLAALSKELNDGKNQVSNSTGDEDLASEFSSLRDSTDRINTRLGDLQEAKTSYTLGSALFSLDDLIRRIQKAQSDVPTPETVDDFVANPQKYLSKELQNRLFYSDPVSGVLKQRVLVYLKSEWLWDSRKYGQFIQDASIISPDFLGLPMLRAELEDYMKVDFKWSTLFAILIIMLVLALDFRGLKLRGATFFSLIALGLGYLWMLGVMGLQGINFNVANILISPLLLGLGVDNCVYLFHRFHDFRSQKALNHGATAKELIEQSTSSTAIPIVANTLAAMISFGSLLIAQTPILRILGESAVIGLGFMTLFSLTLLPSIISLRR